LGGLEPPTSSANFHATLDCQFSVRQDSAEILVLEFEEEARIELSETEGPVLQRRPDADPRAVLGVAVNRSTPAAAKPERVTASLSRVESNDPSEAKPRWTMRRPLYCRLPNWVRGRGLSRQQRVQNRYRS
jgi:hypothetical protein